MSDPFPTSPPPRRSRFGLRSLFVLVTVAAVGITAQQLMQRRAEYLKRATDHASRAVIEICGHSVMMKPGPDFQTFHWSMQAKYERAAMRPWLPVDPDPPEPLFGR